MRQPPGKLPERRQALRSARFLLRFLQPPVGLRQGLREFPVAHHLLAVFRHETVHHHRRQEEKQIPDGQLRYGIRRYLHRREAG